MKKEFHNIVFISSMTATILSIGLTFSYKDYIIEPVFGQTQSVIEVPSIGAIEVAEPTATSNTTEVIENATSSAEEELVKKIVEAARAKETAEKTAQVATAPNATEAQVAAAAAAAEEFKERSQAAVAANESVALAEAIEVIPFGGLSPGEPRTDLRVHVDSLMINRDHDPFASGEWFLYLTANEEILDIENEDRDMYDVDNGQTVIFYNLFVDVSVRQSGALTLLTFGFEEDGGELPDIQQEWRDVAYNIPPNQYIDPSIWTGTYDRIKTGVNWILALDENDELGTITKVYTAADNFGIGAHSEGSDKLRKTLVDTVPRPQERGLRDTVPGDCPTGSEEIRNIRGGIDHFRCGIFEQLPDYVLNYRIIPLNPS